MFWLGFLLGAMVGIAVAVLGLYVILSDPNTWGPRL